MTKTELFVFALALVACNNSGFSGGAAKPASRPPTPASPSDTGDELGSEQAGDAVKDTSTKDKVEEDDDDGSSKPSGNGTLVTQGSFSAWAEPSRPAVEQSYHIFVEIKLPQGTSSYTLADLSGELVGTDNYRQTIESWPKYYPPGGGPAQDAPVPDLIVSGRTARLKIFVPGAQEPAVQDRVTIRSQLLDEQQTLTIRFQ